MNRGVFEVTKRVDAPSNATMMGARFFISIKNNGTPKEAYKAMFFLYKTTPTLRNTSSSIHVVQYASTP